MVNRASPGGAVSYSSAEARGPGTEVWRPPGPARAPRRIAAYRSALDFGGAIAPSSRRAPRGSHRKAPGVAGTQIHRPPAKPGVARSERQVVSAPAHKTAQAWHHREPMGATRRAEPMRRRESRPGDGRRKEFRTPKRPRRGRTGDRRGAGARTRESLRSASRPPRAAAAATSSRSHTTAAGERRPSSPSWTPSTVTRPPPHAEAGRRRTAASRRSGAGTVFVSRASAVAGLLPGSSARDRRRYAPAAREPSARRERPPCRPERPDHIRAVPSAVPSETAAGCL
jgi:hypothetical protein